MFQPHNDHKFPNAYCECCGWLGDIESVNPIPLKGLSERLTIGDPVPAGECPSCGSLTYGVAANFPNDEEDN